MTLDDFQRAITPYKGMVVRVLFVLYNNLECFHLQCSKNCGVCVGGCVSLDVTCLVVLFY